MLLPYPGVLYYTADRPWEDDVIYENTMDFDGHDNEGIFIDAGPQL
jgi:hypothetical protein